MLEADQENVVKEAPQMFQKMVDSYGIERGIDAMVQLMGGGWHSPGQRLIYLIDTDWWTVLLTPDGCLTYLQTLNLMSDLSSQTTELDVCLKFTDTEFDV